MDAAVCGVTEPHSGGVSRADPAAAAASFGVQMASAQFIQKPFSVDALIRKMREAMRDAQAMEAGGAAPIF